MVLVFDCGIVFLRSSYATPNGLLRNGNALIYRYGSPNGLLWNGNALIYRYGSPNGLLRNELRGKIDPPL
jgi:hypothetical protein